MGRINQFECTMFSERHEISAPQRKAENDAKQYVQFLIIELQNYGKKHWLYFQNNFSDKLIKIYIFPHQKL